jgi:ribonuclease D
VTPFSVVSNQVFKNIVHYRPTTLDELRATPEVRDWQVNDYGQAVLAVLDATEATFSPSTESNQKPSRRRGRKNKKPKTS